LELARLALLVSQNIFFWTFFFFEKLALISELDTLSLFYVWGFPPGAFAALGLCYFVSMAIGAYGARVPHPNWRPSGWKDDQQQVQSAAVKLYIDHK
jgi:hypothetical protein